jgi:hypothetical protein
MKDEKKAYKKFASAASQKGIKVEARSKTKDDNMRNFFIKMPSY